MNDTNPFIRYAKLLLRIFNAHSAERGMRLSADDVRLLYMSLSDGVDKDELIAEIKKWEES